MHCCPASEQSHLQCHRRQSTTIDDHRHHSQNAKSAALRPRHPLLASLLPRADLANLRRLSEPRPAAPSTSRVPLTPTCTPEVKSAVQIRRGNGSGRRAASLLSSRLVLSTSITEYEASPALSTFPVLSADMVLESWPILRHGYYVYRSTLRILHVSCSYCTVHDGCVRPSIR